MAKYLLLLLLLLLRTNDVQASCYYTPSVQTEIKHSVTVSNLPVKSGQLCKDAQTPVKQKPKRKRSVAQPIIQEQSPKRTRKPALKTNGKDGSQQVTLAPKTPQRAKAAPTKKQKAAASTTQARKRTAKQTPAQTRTARPSKARGS